MYVMEEWIVGMHLMNIYVEKYNYLEATYSNTLILTEVIMSIIQIIEKY